MTKSLKLIWTQDSWDEDLIGCPSQLYRAFRIEVEEAERWPHKLLEARAYCRWRWQDPWTASVLAPQEDTSSMWISDCIPRVPAFKEPEHKELEDWCEQNFPLHAARIVEGVLTEEADSLKLRRETWEKLKVELGIKW